MKEKTLEEINIQHKKLLKAGESANKLKLIIIAEKGKIYDYLKQEHLGRWKDVCNKLNICRRTAYRYIDFYRIVNCYPRILVCDLSFESIMATYKLMSEYLKHHPTLDEKLRVPLKRTGLKNGNGYFSARRMVGANNSEAEVLEPGELLAKGHSYGAGWELDDVYYKDDE